nr:MAG TPA: tail tape measure protein [Caudoviricetes sp.]
MATLGLDTSEYEQKLETAKKETQSAANSLNRSANTAGSGVLGMASQFAAASAKATVLANMLTSLGTKAVGLAKGFVEMGISYNAQIEKYTTGFTNMLGSAEKAQAVLNQIKQDAARTPLNVDSLVQANQLLISAGVSAGEARSTILALGDAVSATGGGSEVLSRMAANLQQIKNVGKAASIDIRQFAMAGIDIYGVLADYTGKSTTEVKGMTITYDLLTAALQKASEEGGRYYNAMETQSQTLSGRLETLKDNWSQLLGTLTKGLTETEGNLVTAAAGWVQRLQEGFETAGTNGLMQVGSHIVDEVASGISAGIPSLAAQAEDAVQNFALYLQDNTSQIVDTGGKLLTSLANGILSTAPIVANAAVQTVSSFAVELWNNADKIFTAGADLLGKLVEGFLSLTGNVIEATGNITAAIVTKIFTTDWVQIGKDIVSSIGQGILNGVSAMSGPLDRLSYKLNHALGKNGYEENTFEAWAAANGKTGETRYQKGGQKDAAYWKRYGDKLAQQYGLNETGTDTGSGETDATSGGSSGKSAGTKSKTKTVIASVSHTSTSTAQNELGTVVRSIETLDEKVKDASGSIKDRVTETTTETGKEMVNGVETTYKLVTKKVDGVVEKTTKTYDDMSKTLLGTLTTTAKKVFDGITTTTQKATETYADGSQHVKETVTETGERIVGGAAQTYTKVINYVDGVKDKVTETAEIIDQSVKGVQSRIEQYASEISNQTSKGIIGRLKTAFSQLSDGDFAGLSLTFVKLLFGQVDQKQREAMLKWLSQALDVINEGYNGGGLGKAFDVFQKIFNGEGVKADIDGVTTSVKGLSAVLGELAKAGGAGGILANIGTGIAGVGGKIMGVLGNVVAFVVENPIVLAIAAVVAGAAALGIALWKKYGKSSSDNKSSTGKIGYKDIQDAYWYGNERAFAGYDYRTDPYTFRSTNGEMQSYQSRIQEAVSGLYDVVKEYLPQTANQQIVLEDGTLVGAIAPGMDAQLGQLAALAERGN